MKQIEKIQGYLSSYQLSNPERIELSKEEVMNFLKEREKELVEGIDLFDGVKIRRISKEDLEDLKTPFLSTLHPFKELAPHMFVLEKYITVEDEHDFQADTIMRNVVLALRLLKRGYVSGSRRCGLDPNNDQIPATPLETAREQGEIIQSFYFLFLNIVV